MRRRLSAVLIAAVALASCQGASSSIPSGNLASSQRAAAQKGRGKVHSHAGYNPAVCTNTTTPLGAVTEVSPPPSAGLANANFQTVAVKNDGTIWAVAAGVGSTGALVKYNPSTGHWTTFPIPSGFSLTANGVVGNTALTMGPQGGDPWLGSGDGKIVRFKGGTTGFDTPFVVASTSPATAIVDLDPDNTGGTYMYAGVLGPTTGTIKISNAPTPTHTNIPLASSELMGVSTDSYAPDQGVWFTDHVHSKLYRMDIATQAFTPYNVPTGSYPWGITEGPPTPWGFNRCGSASKVRMRSGAWPPMEA